ncbi:MAG: pyridoxal phosphate-dependent aminotransferase [Deltaproteobacteria bacterium]
MAISDDSDTDLDPPQTSVRFSRRTDWPDRPNALARLLEQRAGQQTLDLTRTNPTDCGLEQEGPRILAALSREAGLRYQPEPFGLRSAREAVAAWLSAEGRAVPAERIAITASTSEAYGLLFKLLGDPGDRAAIPAPSYPLFDFLAEAEGLLLSRYRLAFEGDWRLDRASLLEALSMPGVAAAIVIQPNNPTGSVLTPSELDFVTDACRERGVALLSDEVFWDYPLEGQADWTSAASQDRCLTFTLGGLSKLAGLPQLKLGWIAVTGPAAPVREALRRLELLLDSTLSVGSPVQEALPELFAMAPAFQARLRTRLRENLAVARRAFGPPNPVTVLSPQGGWSLVLRVPAVAGAETGEAWALSLLDEDGLLVQPGYFYDFEGEAYLVVSLLTPPPDFAEGLALIAQRAMRMSDGCRA